MGGYLRTNGLKVPECAAMHISGPYRWRGFRGVALGVPPARLRLDPPELRRGNLIPADALPCEVDLGPEHEPNLYDSGDYPLMFERLLEHAGYERLKQERAERRERGELVGI